MRKVVLYCATRGMYHDMQVCMKSLLSNTSVDKIYCFIEDDQFPYQLPDIVECINIRNHQYFHKSSPNYETRCTYMCMMRCAASKILQDEDVVLSLDCDTLCIKSIDSLFDTYVPEMTKTTQNCFCAIREIPVGWRWRKPTDPYFNFGVVLLNLKMIRELGVDDIAINLLNATKYADAEQDVMNILCKGKIVEMPSVYNVSNFTEPVNDHEQCVIMHYAGKKIWQSSMEPDYYGIYQSMTFDEAMNREAKKEDCESDR